jgi:hypothetical protein
MKIHTQVSIQKEKENKPSLNTITQNLQTKVQKTF